MEMVRLMDDIVEEWQEIEGKDTVVCVIDHVRMEGYERKWRGCIENE